MTDKFKSLLNEDQDSKAVEKITAKLEDLLMKNEEIGYIGVQKKPAITVFPDSIVLTNKRIIICRPKHLGLSMDFTDYPWENVGATIVKENILGSEFSFTTTTDITISIDYLPKSQARKIYTYAKEQLELLKQIGVTLDVAVISPIAPALEIVDEAEEVEAEEVANYAELFPVAQSGYRDEKQHPEESPAEQSNEEIPLDGMTSEQLFEKLQNYKRLLDNGLILQGEYDVLKKDILGKM